MYDSVKILRSNLLIDITFGKNQALFLKNLKKTEKSDPQNQFRRLRKVNFHPFASKSN